MILLVTYNVAEKKRDYSNLYSALQSSPATSWWHYIDSTWLIKTAETPAQMLDRLRPFIDDDDDSILITPVLLASYSGWLPKKAWAWIKDNK